MLSTFNYYIFIGLLLFTILVFIINARHKETIIKLLIGVSLLSIFIYSGYGISNDDVDNSYILPYVVFVFLFALFMNLGITLGCKCRFQKPATIVLRHEVEKYKLNISHKTSVAFTLVFMITLLIPLIYPEFRLLDIFRFSGLNMGDIYYKVNLSKSNFVTKLASTIQTFVIPFFMIYLSQKLNKGNKKIVVTFVVIWIYLDFLQFNYLGRYDIMVYAIFLMIIIFLFNDSGQIVITKKKIAIILSVSFFILLPLMNVYMYIREGWSYENTGVFGAINHLLESETYYPKYYDVCTNNSDLESPKQFLAWLFSIPIPSFVWKGKPDNTVSYTFTYLISGKVYGQSFYSSLLPSVLGEAIMIFGKDYSFICAIIAGSIIGFIFGKLYHIREANIFLIYMALMSAKLGRAGLASYLPTLINSSISLLLYMIIDHQRKIHSSHTL